MDLRNYYDMFAQLQERMLRPALEKLLPVMAISCRGFVPEDLEIVFEPVMTTSPAERAELVQKLSTVKSAFFVFFIDYEVSFEYDRYSEDTRYIPIFRYGSGLRIIFI